MIENIFENTGIEFICNEMMRDHTYYKIGGPAKIFISPKNSTELRTAIEILNRGVIDYFVLGKGSNILVSDSGYDVCIIDMSKYFTKIFTEGGAISAETGCTMSALALFAENNNLSGLEELAGIPGTLGGALVMNAGCYGSEIGSKVESVRVIIDGQIAELSKQEISFGYRSSNLKGMIVISANIALTERDIESISRKRLEYLNKRNKTQPVNLPSCGSVFKRPQNAFAGELIEKAGLKGRSIGDAQISEKHAGFIVNKGNATAENVRELINEIKNEIWKNFQVKLEEEVIYLGFKDRELK